MEKTRGLSLFWAWSLLRSYRGGSRETAARLGSQEHISLNPVDLTLLSALLSLPLDFPLSHSQMSAWLWPLSRAPAGRSLRKLAQQLRHWLSSACQASAERRVAVC